MNKATEQVKVIFKKRDGEVIAFFPALAGDCNPYRTCLCYAHVGQHGSASLEYYQSCKPAQPAEYADLLKELQVIYEGQLKPAERMTRSDFKARQEQTRR